jgi:hypothetical protein
MRDDEHGKRSIAQDPDEPLTVEPLDAPGAMSHARPYSSAPTWLAALAPTWAGQPLTRRTRALRMGVIVTLVAAALFTLLGGPAQVNTGWARLAAELASQPVVRPLAMTAWQAISEPPAGVGVILSYTPDPVNPARVYACASGPSAFSVWRTDDRGGSWREELAKPALPDSLCQIKLAPDTPSVALVALVVLTTYNPFDPGCGGLTPYLSDSSQERWTFVQLPLIPGACLGDIWPSDHALYYWWTDAQGSRAVTGLQRSYDGGATWNPISLAPMTPGAPAPGFSLAPALLDSGSGDTIMTQIYFWPSASRPNASDQLWRSLDGGFSWRFAPNAPLGAQLFSTTNPSALRDADWPPVYAAIYNGGELSPPWNPTPQQEPVIIQALQPNGSTWRDVPALPLRPNPNPAPQSPPLGIIAPLDVGPGGSLLALGERPGAVATRDPQASLWLWVWDPAERVWRAGAQAPDDAALAGLTWADGTSGAYLWLTGLNHGYPSLYWSFIPTTQAS